MKVAYFAGSLVKNLDGVSRVLYKISEYNKYNGIDSVFLSPEIDPLIGSPAVALKGVRIPFYKQYKFSISGISFVEKKLAEQNFHPELIHVHSPCPAGWIGLKLAKKRNLPLVATYHTHFPSYLGYYRAQWLSPLVKKYLHYFYTQCDTVLVPSVHIQEELALAGIQHTKVLPHGVDFTRFNKQQYSLGLKQSEGTKKILLYGGRLVWEKNLHVLMEAINSLSERRNDFVLWIAGTGPAEAALQRQLKNSVFFGFCETKKLAQLYATADIFVFPSSTETFGNVTLEAMASGTPCIVANARGSADLIQHEKNGLLFDPENAGELAAKLEELLDDEAKRKQFAQSAFASSQSYRWKALLNLQKEVYTDLLSSRPAKHTIGDSQAYSKIA